MSPNELDARIVTFHQRALEVLESPDKPAVIRERIRDLLVKLAQEPEIIPDVALNRLHTSGSSATILLEGSDGRGALMLLQLPATAPTPVHNHHSWGVSCVVKGRNRYWAWRRFDDGDDPDRGDLRLDKVFDQRPGDATIWDDPPHDWHAQQGIDDEAIEFVFFGTNPLLRSRAYFDPETGTISHAFASDRMIKPS